MANVIKLKRSSTATNVPTLAAGEVGINYADRKIYHVGSDGTTVEDVFAHWLSPAEASVASAATTNIGTANANRVSITGTTTITSFGSSTNRLRFVRFTGALTLTHNATSLILPGGANVTTAAGDTCWAASDGSGNWRVYDYTLASGRPLVGGQQTGGTVGQRLVKQSSTNYDAAWTDEVLTLNFVINGGGSAIGTGVAGDLVVDFACTITAWTILADQTGSIVVDVWKDTYANFPPVVGDSIAGTAKPTLSSASKNQNTSLSGWGSTAISAGDVLRFNVDSASTVTRVTVAIKVKRTA